MSRSNDSVYYLKFNYTLGMEGKRGVYVFIKELLWILNSNTVKGDRILSLWILICIAIK